MKRNNVKPANERRDFLRQVATGAAAMSLTMLTPAIPASAGSLLTSSDADPEAWLNKIKGKHRIVFDVTEPRSILPFAWSRVFLITNEKTGTPEKESSVVVVLRHGAIPFAMESKLWEKYKFGEMFKVNDEATKASSTRNMFWQPKEGDFKIPGLGNVAIGINELQDSGVIFCVCDMALTVYSAAAALQMNKEAAEVKKEWVAGVLPGIEIVPSGVWAVGRAQEHQCSYCFVA